MTGQEGDGIVSELREGGDPTLGPRGVLVTETSPIVAVETKSTRDVERYMGWTVPHQIFIVALKFVVKIIKKVL